MNFKDRIQKMVRVSPSKIRANPFNHRTHDDQQRAALDAILQEIGVAGAVLARELEDGTYELIDGHLRHEMLGNQKIPLLVLDLAEAESKKLLFAYDAIGGMAGVDPDKVTKLCKEVKTKSQALADLFSGMKSSSGALDPADLELDMEDDGEGEDLLEETATPEILPSHVRMVQLFLNTETITEFEDAVKQLGQKYGTQSATDTVMECLRRAVKQSANSAPTKKKKSKVVA